MFTTSLLHHRKGATQPHASSRRASTVRLVLLLTLVLAAVPFLPTWMPSASIVNYIRSKLHVAPTTRDYAMQIRAANDRSPLHPDQRVVVSISTFTGRMDKVKHTLRSLLDQSRRADVVYLAIPRVIERLNEQNDSKKEDDDEERIRHLEDSFGDALSLRVLRIPDYGPTTKLLAALSNEEDPETVVITLDDDTEYHRDLILFLLDAIVRNPGHAPCFVCEFWLPFFGAIGQHWEGLCSGWGMAFAGIAYRVGYFGPDVYDHSTAPKGCKLFDDAWISGSMYRNGHRPFVIQPGFNPCLVHRSSGNLSISSIPGIGRDHRDPCIRHFNMLY